MEISLFKNIARFPFILEDELHNSTFLSQNKHCLSCKTRECAELLDSAQNEYICKQGFNSFKVKLNDGFAILNGLITDDNKDIKKGRLEARKEYFFPRSQITIYLEELSKISEFVNEGVNNNIHEKFTLFHDVRSSYAIAYANLEAYILAQQGSSFIEKLQNCHIRIIDLYDSLDLVTSQLDLIDVMVNPAAIVQGSKRDINIFKLTHKLVKLFKTSAEKRGLTIEYRSYENIPYGNYHDSIKLIPIILIENAIKYSEKNRRIIITIEYQNSKISFKISTYGRIIPEQDRDKVFEKQIRGENSKYYTDEGLGMGLYIAKRILAEHGGTIKYDFEIKVPGFGFNIFTFEL